MVVENGQNLKTITLIDTGSSENIMDMPTYSKLCPQPQLRKLSSEEEVYPYSGSHPLPVLGVTTLRVYTPATGKSATLKYSIVNGNSGNILSWRASEELGLVEVKVSTCNLDTRANNNAQEDILREYQDLFTGIGKIKDTEIKLHIDDSIPPKAQKHRTVPFHVRADVESELQRLQNLDIIEPVEGPTPWVSPGGVGRDFSMRQHPERA
jgi:hypothetical protein